MRTHIQRLVAMGAAVITGLSACGGGSSDGGDGQAEGPGTNPPNILFVVMDDVGIDQMAAFGYGGASQFALTAYLATLGRDKVGFSPADNARGLVGGLRGVAERNTMRYYLAIDAYLGSLATAQPQQLERRLATWFDATERYARQLHEVARDDYLRMKRNECRRLLASAARQ